MVSLRHTHVEDVNHVVSCHPSRLAPEEFRAITQQVGLPVGVLTVGVMTVGAMTVGVLTVGAMGRPHFPNWSRRVYFEDVYQQRKECIIFKFFLLIEC